MASREGVEEEVEVDQAAGVVEVDPQMLQHVEEHFQCYADPQLV